MTREERTAKAIAEYEAKKIRWAKEYKRPESRLKNVAKEIEVSETIKRDMLSRDKRKSKYCGVRCVYGLVDATKKELFYVGTTKNLARRLAKHRRVRRCYPEVVILQLNPDKQSVADWPWIDFFKEKGIELQQVTLEELTKRSALARKGKPRRAYKRKPFLP